MSLACIRSKIFAFVFLSYLMSTNTRDNFCNIFARLHNTASRVIFQNMHKNTFDQKFKNSYEEGYDTFFKVIFGECSGDLIDKIINQPSDEEEKIKEQSDGSNDEVKKPNKRSRDEDCRDERKWSNLPDLILEKIFSNLSTRHRYYASMVCKNWYEAFHLPNVWRYFVFDDETLTRRLFNYHSGWQVWRSSKVRFRFQNISFSHSLSVHAGPFTSAILSAPYRRTYTLSHFETYHQLSQFIRIHEYDFFLR